MYVQVVDPAVAVPVLVEIVSHHAAAADIDGIVVQLIPAGDTPAFAVTPPDAVETVVVVLTPVQVGVARLGTLVVERLAARERNIALDRIGEIADAVAVAQLKLETGIPVAVEVFQWQTRAHAARKAQISSGIESVTMPAKIIEGQAEFAVPCAEIQTDVEHFDGLPRNILVGNALGNGTVDVIAAEDSSAGRIGKAGQEFVIQISVVPRLTVRCTDFQILDEVERRLFPEVFLRNAPSNGYRGEEDPAQVTRREARRCVVAEDEFGEVLAAEVVVETAGQRLVGIVVKRTAA